MTRLTFIFILTIASATCCFSQTKKDTVDKVIQADTVYFDLVNGGCFNRSTESIVISIIAKDKYNVSYKNDENVTRQASITRETLLKFAQLYKTELTKKGKGCVSTSWTAFTLKSKNDTVEFWFEGCNDKDNPYSSFLKILKVK